MYIPSIMSLVFVLSFAKLKETNERNRFYSASMDEVFLRKKLIFAKLSLSYFNEYINFAFFSYWIANHEIFRIFYTFMCFLRKKPIFAKLSLSYLNEYVNSAFFSYWIANHEIFQFFCILCVFLRKKPIFAKHSLS